MNIFTIKNHNNRTLSTQKSQPESQIYLYTRRSDFTTSRSKQRTSPISYINTPRWSRTRITLDTWRSHKNHTQEPLDSPSYTQDFRTEKKKREQRERAFLSFEREQKWPKHKNEFWSLSLLISFFIYPYLLTHPWNLTQPIRYCQVGLYHVILEFASDNALILIMAPAVTYWYITAEKLLELGFRVGLQLGFLIGPNF